MGSCRKAFIATMKTFQNVLTILLLGLASTRVNGKVNSCLQCESGPDGEDSGCVEGTSKGLPCGLDMEGCYALRFVGKVNGMEGDVTVWDRGCCFGNQTLPGSCLEIHRDVDKWDLNDVAYTGRFDQSWCTANNCNKMDPTNSARTLVPALTVLLTTVAIMTCTNF